METGAVFANLFTGLLVFWSFVAIYLISGRKPQQAQVSGVPVTDQEKEEVLLREHIIEKALSTSLVFRLRHGSLGAQRRLSRKPRLRLVGHPSTRYNDKGRMHQPPSTIHVE